MKINYYQRSTVPAAFVTKGRQRVKQFNDIVYLRNGDEFEIELFNPTTNKVSAKISLNGKYLGNAIVLRPGERVFLERYFDEAKKFLFETYQINGNDPNVQEAIKMNGIVEVEFYDEYKPYKNTWWNNNTFIFPHSSGDIGTPGIYYTHTTDSVSYGGTMSACCSPSSVKSVNFTKNLNEEVETGRVEKGSFSNQDFDYDSTSFNSYYSWKTTWKILPESQKVFVSEDIKVFCANCGAKRKKSSHKFCPNCGSKF